MGLPSAAGGPHSLQVELTSHCNLKCRMCPLTTGETLSSAQSGAMKGAVWGEVLVAAQAAGEVIVTGFGEALTSVECLPRLRELDARGVHIGLATNGTPLTEGVSRELAALANLAHVNVSIDSPDPDAYRDIRGGEVERALRGVANLLAAIDEPRKVTVSSVLMRGSLESLAAFPALLARMGVRKWILQSSIDYTPRSRPDGVADAAGASRDIARIRGAAEDAGIELVYTLPARVDLELRDAAGARHAYHDEASRAARVTRQCCLPWETPYVDKDGRVFPCCFAATDRGAVLGDLRDDPLEAVWNGAPYAAFRAGLLGEGGGMPVICRRCNVVPLGEHPLARFSAAFVPERSELEGTTHVVVAMRNTGSTAWLRGAPLRIGTTTPRDRRSALFHDTWPASSRAAEIREEIVNPGEVATFRFEVAAAETRRAEAFQLVAEGLAWLPGTRFEIPPKAQAVVRGYHATLEEGIDFTGRPGYPAFIRTVRGLSVDEPDGRWTDGPEVVLEFACPLPSRFVLRLETQRAFDPLAGRPMWVRVGDWQGSAVVGWQPEVHELRVATRRPAQSIVFTLMDPVSPREIGAGSDTRRLGVMFRRISIDPRRDLAGFWRLFRLGR